MLIDKIFEIQSGQRSGPIAIAVRAALWVASVPYRYAVGFRNRQYDRGRKEIHRVAAPVVCIGNLTTGGTGKTPIVCHLARWLRDQGVRVAIVSRGYHSDDSGVNDEAKELSRHLPDVPHVQDADRVRAAQIAIEELESEFLLMDDGFQHRRLHRNVDVVVVDATNPFGYRHLIPRGLLREPIASIKRAGAVILTRCDLVSDHDLSAIEHSISQHLNADTPILRTRHAVSAVRTHPDAIQSIESLCGKRIVTVCAIGNPQAFEQTVSQCGVEIIDHIRLPDHDEFGPQSISRLHELAQSRSDEFDLFLCTDKDLVKIESDRIAGKPIAALQIELMFDSDASPLYELLAACCD